MAQFEALAKLIGMRDTRSKKAARLVLVVGLYPSEAALATGVSLSAVTNAVARCNRAIALARQVVLPDTAEPCESEF